MLGEVLLRRGGVYLVQNIVPEAADNAVVSLEGRFVMGPVRLARNENSRILCRQPQMRQSQQASEQAHQSEL